MGDEGILPRALWGGQDLLDRHRLETGSKRRSVGPVSIPQQNRSVVSHGNALRICWAVHSAVGCPVTLT